MDWGDYEIEIKMTVADWQAVVTDLDLARSYEPLEFGTVKLLSALHDKGVEI